MSDILFSLFHCTARPWDWQNACLRFRAAADNPEQCEYVLGIHRRQQELLGSQSYPFHLYYQSCAMQLQDAWPRHWAISVNLGRPCVVDNANTAAAHTSGKIMVSVADGLRPCPHWDTELLKAIDDPNKPYLIKTSHGDYLPDSWIVTHGIITRALYEKWGYVAWPEYIHYGCDDDTTLMAERDGYILDATHLNFPYHHWSNGKREVDSITKHTAESGAWKVRERVLDRRKEDHFRGRVQYGWWMDVRGEAWQTQQVQRDDDGGTAPHELPEPPVPFTGI